MTIRRVRVGEVLRLDRTPVELKPGRDYVAVGVRSFGKGIFHYDPKPGDELGKLRFFELPPDRLVISNIKGWEGAVAVSTEADVGCVASNRFLLYSPVDDRVDIDWARWFFLSEAGLPLIQQASPGSADRNRTLAIGRFESLEIPLPPIDEQVQLAGRLNTASSGAAHTVALLGRSNELIDAFAVSLCSQPDLGVPEREGRGWREVPLSSVLQRSSDSVAVVPSGRYPNLGIYSFGRGVFNKPPIEAGNTSATKLNRVKSGQFIYSRLFAFEGAYAYVPPEFDGYYVSNEFPAFDVDPAQVDARWLATYLRSPTRWAELGGASKGMGVRRQRVPAEAVLAYKVWLPPIEQQLEHLRMLDRLDHSRVLRRSVDEHIAAVMPAALNEAFAAVR
jgi:type I restriction enzyme S subunit